MIKTQWNNDARRFLNGEIRSEESQDQASGKPEITPCRAPLMSPDKVDLLG
jgi:hypothetical protein